MKRALVFFLTVLYILAMIRPAFPILKFYANQDFIAEFLCINKDKPKLQCNGKCQLSKMLTEDSESEKIPSLDLREYPLSLITSSKKKTVLKRITSKNVILGYISNYNYLSDFSLLKPPETSSLHIV